MIELRVLTRRQVGTPSRARAKSWLIFFQIPEQSWTTELEYV
jgi:hypothetical protein